MILIIINVSILGGIYPALIFKTIGSTVLYSHKKRYFSEFAMSPVSININEIKLSK